MQFKPWLYAFVCCTSLFICSQILGQTAGPPAGLEKESIYTQGTISQEQMKNLADFIDQRKLQDGKNLVKPRTAAERAVKALAALKVNCNVAEAMQISRFVSKDAANSMAGLYEASCENGTGFVIIIRPDQQVAALSCFAVDAMLSTRTAGSEEAGMPAVQCRLPENSKATTRAKRILSRLGVTCNVNKTAWLGQDPKSNLEYYEAGCDNNMRYVIHAPIPGHQGTLGITDCAASVIPCVEQAEAARQEAALQQAARGRPDLAWFKEQLAHAGVVCDVKQGRIIGRESIKRRYVAEFECKGSSEGVVAFVPSPGDTTSTFESMSCSAAAAKHIVCEYTKIPASAPK